MNVGTLVKVIDQDISGVVVEVWGNKAIIEDDCSEYEAPDNRLEFHISDLKEIA